MAVASSRADDRASSRICAFSALASSRSRLISRRVSASASWYSRRALSASSRAVFASSNCWRIVCCRFSIIPEMRGITFFAKKARISTKTIHSKMNVPLGTRKLFVFSAAASLAAAASTTVACIDVSSLAEDEREQRGERQVDEVRRLDQADGEEELAGELALRLGLA